MTNKVPQTYLENIDVLNSVSQFINEDNNILLNSNSNILSNNNQKVNSNYNSFSFNKTQNDNSTNIQSMTQKESFLFPRINNREIEFKINNTYNRLNTSNNENNSIFNNTLDQLNNKKKFAWKEIMEANNNLNIEDDLDNPLIQNILNSELKENEIKNIPENHLINLIQTLQGIAINAIENKNDLILENQKLYNDLSQTKIDNENISHNNSKLNQYILYLNKENEEQKKLIKNYENKLIIDNPNNINLNTEYDNLEENYYSNKNGKKKYYCQFCTNKKFKTLQYLEEHIQRRHIKYYYQYYLNKQNKKEKFNYEKYNKKLNDLKKYFNSLIYQSIKKAQYVRLNEKINGLQNLILMKKNQNQNYYNYYENNNDDNINYDNNNNDDNNYNYNKEDEYKNNNNLQENNYNNDVINEKKNNNKESNQNIINTLKKLKNDMKQFYDKNMKEILEINNEKKFQFIKKYFENTSEQSSPLHHSRRNKKIKTTKFVQKDGNILSQSQKELNQSADEIKKEDIKESNNVNYNSNEDNINNQEILKQNNKKNNHSHKNNNNTNNNSEKSSEEDKFKKEMNFYFSESDSQMTENWKSLSKFYKNFRNRDGYFSRGQKENYLNKIIPNEYNINKKEINNKIKEKMNKKLLDLKDSTNEDLITDIIKLYYQLLDKNSIYGNVHIFYSNNMINFMGIKKLIDNVNDIYYQGRQVGEIKPYKDRSIEVNQGPLVFEKVNYQIENEENEDNERNNFSFGH